MTNRKPLAGIAILFLASAFAMMLISGCPLMGSLAKITCSVLSIVLVAAAIAAALGVRSLRELVTSSRELIAEISSLLRRGK
ncbi:MAG TPA: hypothetical protein VGM88_08610 [Kofleriaceae bacterium]|jgi:hypothetical protein